MATITFTDYTTAVPASWLNDVNDTVYEFTQSGTSPSTRTATAKLRDYLYEEDFGMVGDNVTDDSTAFTNALNASATLGKELHLDGTKTYLLAASTFDIPAGARIRTHGAGFTSTSSTASNTIWLTINDNVVIDEFSLTIPTGVQRDRAIAVTGADIRIGRLELISVDTQANAESNDFGVRVLSCSNPVIGQIKVTNYDRPVIIGSNTDANILSLELSTYVRGAWIYDNINLYIGASRIHTASANASVTSGHNGVLLSSNSADAQRNVTLDNFIVENSGEHAIRVGGDFRQSNIFITRPRIYAPGGCGIKVLGTDVLTPTARNSTIQISEPIIEDCGTSVSAPNNRCGILVQFADDVQITSPIIRPRNNTSCASVGIRIESSTNVLVSNPLIIHPAKEGIQIHAENGDTDRIQISGGLVFEAQTYGLAAICDATRTVRRLVVDGLTCDGGADLGFNIDFSAGTAVDSLFRLKLYNNTNGAGASDSASAFLDCFGAVGSTPLSGITCGNGSQWSDGTTLNIRKAGAWTAL